MAYLETRICFLTKQRGDLYDCITAANKALLLPVISLSNFDKLHKLRNIFAHNWAVDILDHERIKPQIDSLHVDQAWIMPDRCNSRAFVANVLAYAAIDINREISRRKIEPAY